MAALKKTKSRGEMQKERKKRGVVSSVVVTSLSSSIAAQDAVVSIISAFKNVCLLDTSPHKRALGQRVITKRGSFTFFSNTVSSIFMMKMKIMSADINIVVVDGDIDMDKEEMLRKTKQDNILFLSCARSPAPETKKYVKNIFGRDKLYSLAEMPRVLETKKVVNRRKHSRPLMVADTLEQISQTCFKITGHVSKGFTSYNILLNGVMQAKIVQINSTDGPLPLRSLELLTKEEIYGAPAGKKEGSLVDMIKNVRINDSIDEYLSDDDSLGKVQGQWPDEIDEVNELNEIDDSSEYDSDSDSNSEFDGDNYNIGGSADCDSNSECSTNNSNSANNSNINNNDAYEKEELYEKYKEYKGFRTINLGSHKKEDVTHLKTFRTQNLPEYYKDLSFIGSDQARKKILAKKSFIPTNTSLELYFEIDPQPQTQDLLLNSIIDNDFLSVHGLYDYEGLPTISTFSFSSLLPISQDMSGSISFDYGFAITTPKSIAIGTGTEIIKCRQEASSGTICCITPLILTDDRVLLLQKNMVIGTAAQILRKDPILIKTIVFRGRPVKIRKRSCIVGKMFHSRQEVLFFQNLSLYSNTSKKGRIKRPLGQHGLMKCYFFPPVKHGEKIYMELAKRVYLSPSEIFNIS